MNRYYSEGGAKNPHFPHRVKKVYPLTEAIEWCNEYSVKGQGYFQRYYVEFTEGDANYATFQFEQEEPAIMFTLKFAK